MSDPRAPELKTLARQIRDSCEDIQSLINDLVESADSDNPEQTLIAEQLKQIANTYTRSKQDTQAQIDLIKATSDFVNAKIKDDPQLEVLEDPLQKAINTLREYSKLFHDIFQSKIASIHDSKERITKYPTNKAGQQRGEPSLSRLVRERQFFKAHDMKDEAEKINEKINNAFGSKSDKEMFKKGKS